MGNVLYLAGQVEASTLEGVGKQGRCHGDVIKMRDGDDGKKILKRRVCFEWVVASVSENERKFRRMK